MRDTESLKERAKRLVEESCAAQGIPVTPPPHIIEVVAAIIRNAPPSGRGGVV